MLILIYAQRLCTLIWHNVSVFLYHSFQTLKDSKLRKKLHDKYTGFFFVLKIYLSSCVYICVCIGVYLCEYSCLQRPEEGLDALELELWMDLRPQTTVLRTELPDLLQKQQVLCKMCSIAPGPKDISASMNGATKKTTLCPEIWDLRLQRITLCGNKNYRREDQPERFFKLIISS